VSLVVGFEFSEGDETLHHPNKLYIHLHDNSIWDRKICLATLFLLFVVFILRDWFCYVAQAGLKLLGSRNPPALASWVVVTMGTCLCASPEFSLLAGGSQGQDCQCSVLISRVSVTSSEQELGYIPWPNSTPHSSLFVHSSPLME
jgi:hypothetical protein